MDIGLMIRYGRLVPGRENQAVELFREAVNYWTEKQRAGTIAYFEPFFLQTSDREKETGFFVIKGPVAEIFKLMEEEPYLKLIEKAMVLVEHLQVDLLTVGEGIEHQLERSAMTRAELGL